jgi:hypothetical protein
LIVGPLAGSPPVAEYKIIEQHEGLTGRYATVEVGGKRFFCGVERGKSVRIAYKPRGKNRGFHWHGFVRDAQGKTIWSEQVSKSAGVRGLLRYAGLIDHVRLAREAQERAQRLYDAAVSLRDRGAMQPAKECFADAAKWYAEARRLLGIED